MSTFICNSWKILYQVFVYLIIYKFITVCWHFDIYGKKEKEGYAARS